MVKIAVYAIARDEKVHAERWYNSMKEADGVFVLDTGSVDGTPDILRKLGATVECREVKPWNFAVARNASMELVPTEFDVLVCTDLDETFTDGWAEAVRRSLEEVPQANSASCSFVTAFNSDGTAKDSMLYWKIHRRSAGAYWKARVHEYLEFPSGRIDVFIGGMRLEHRPDATKSREQYLELLKGEYEQVHDPRSVHYYARELFFRRRHEEAINTFLEHLSMDGSDWLEERAWSMRYIGISLYATLGANVAYGWFWKSAAECLWMREPLCDLAEIAYREGDYRLCEMACRFALSRNDRRMDYFTEEDAWGCKPLSLLSDALVKLGDAQGAKYFAEEAVAMKPSDARLKDNLAFIISVIRNKTGEHKT